MQINDTTALAIIIAAAAAVYMYTARPLQRQRNIPEGQVDEIMAAGAPSRLLWFGFGTSAFCLLCISAIIYIVLSIIRSTHSTLRNVEKIIEDLSDLSLSSSSIVSTDL
jgi:ABC-type nitrate/sulfonate/bicarbonate transport system permease component